MRSKSEMTEIIMYVGVTGLGISMLAYAFLPLFEGTLLKGTGTMPLIVKIIITIFIISIFLALIGAFFSCDIHSI